jgi:hypothetical protein
MDFCVGVLGSYEREDGYLVDFEQKQINKVSIRQEWLFHFTCHIFILGREASRNKDVS